MKLIWCMVPEISSTTDKFFCHFGPFFTLSPPNNPKNQNFEKMNKISGDIIILHRCTINDNHMMHGSWDMKRDEQIFCHFGPFFALLPHKILKNQNFEKLKKKVLEISSFYTSVPRIMIIFLRFPKIWHVTDVSVIFHFGLFFIFLPP